MTVGDLWTQPAVELKFFTHLLNLNVNVETMGATHDHLRRKRCLKMEQKVLGHFWYLNLLLIPPDVSD